MSLTSEGSNLVLTQPLGGWWNGESHFGIYLRLISHSCFSITQKHKMQLAYKVGFLFFFNPENQTEAQAATFCREHSKVTLVPLFLCSFSLPFIDQLETQQAKASVPSVLPHSSSALL